VDKDPPPLIYVAIDSSLETSSAVWAPKIALRIIRVRSLPKGPLAGNAGAGTKYLFLSGGDMHSSLENDLECQPWRSFDDPVWLLTTGAHELPCRSPPCGDVLTTWDPTTSSGRTGGIGQNRSGFRRCGRSFVGSTTR